VSGGAGTAAATAGRTPTQNALVGPTQFIPPDTTKTARSCRVVVIPVVYRYGWQWAAAGGSRQRGDGAVRGGGVCATTTQCLISLINKRG